MGMGEEVGRRHSWRGVLRRELSLLMLGKLAALILLWWLFFSPTHRAPVDAAKTGRRLALEQQAGGGADARTDAAAAPRPGERLD
jgi:hypothetical protein